MSDDEPRSCHPTDGLYKRGHEACENCAEQPRRVCQVFAERVHGMNPLEPFERTPKSQEADDDSDDALHDRLDAFAED